MNETPRREVKWSYGVTTVKDRTKTTLMRTLSSLSLAGFRQPVVFVDGYADLPDDIEEVCLYVVVRPRRLGAFLNWVLALWELYGREPEADLYAIFQDDLLAVKNLRQYLEATLINSAGRPTRSGYYNLFTSVGNHEFLTRRGRVTVDYSSIGWEESSQLGWHATGLVFDRDAVITLLSDCQHIVRKPCRKSKGRNDRNIDGAVADALTDRVDGPRGWKEWVHIPSLIQHVGEVSTMGHGTYSPSPSFPGEAFDAMSLLTPAVSPTQSQPQR